MRVKIMPKEKKLNSKLQGIDKELTGIKGFDEITFGGIPKGRPTLICGNTGCGKTLMALEIIIRGAVMFNKPGVFLTFEEKKEDIIKNVASLGFDLEDLERKKLVNIEYIHVDARRFEETGEYDLEGLFIRIDCALQKIKARRLAIDTIEVLFSGFDNELILRNELRRLFDWFKENKLTTVLAGEEGHGTTLTRYGIEEYVADCVVSLTNQISDDLYTRRLQIVKYRGSYHETNRFPFIISRHGVVILPITSIDLDFKAPHRWLSSGIPDLDLCLGDKGYFEGSTILFSGTSGAGKTIFAGAFAKSLCSINQKVIFFTYEESESEILRNLSSIGMNLHESIHKGLLKIISTRPTQFGLERHLGNFIQEVEEFKPQAVIIDPIGTFCHCGSIKQVYSVLTRMIDLLKKRNITFIMTMGTLHDKDQELLYGITSIIDTLILLRNKETNGEFNRDLVIVKTRGMGHSNQVREFSISESGIKISNPYYGEEGVLTGTARIVQESKDAIAKGFELNKLEKLHREIELKKRLIKTQIECLKTELEFKTKEANDEENFLKLKNEISNSTKKLLKQHRFSKENNKSMQAKHEKKRKK